MRNERNILENFLFREVADPTLVGDGAIGRKITTRRTEVHLVSKFPSVDCKIPAVWVFVVLLTDREDAKCSEVICQNPLFVVSDWDVAEDTP